MSDIFIVNNEMNSEKRVVKSSDHIGAVLHSIRLFRTFGSEQKTRSLCTDRSLLLPLRIGVCCPVPIWPDMAFPGNHICHLVDYLCPQLYQ